MDVCPICGRSGYVLRSFDELSGDQSSDTPTKQSSITEFTCRNNQHVKTETGALPCPNYNKVIGRDVVEKFYCCGSVIFVSGSIGFSTPFGGECSPEGTVQVECPTCHRVHSFDVHTKTPDIGDPAATQRYIERMQARINGPQIKALEEE